MNSETNYKKLLPNERLQLLTEKVRSHLHFTADKYPNPYHDPIYRMQHTLRVANYGKIIAQNEGANVELVIAACLLHDIAHFESEADYKNHGRFGAQISRPILIELGYSAEDIGNICYSIAVHVDGNAGYEYPATLEADVVSDADNIDRFGAYRVIQWCTMDNNDYGELIEKLKNRIIRLESYQKNNPLETQTGKRLFEKQLMLQINFFNEIINEGEITRTPTINN